MYYITKGSHDIDISKKSDLKNKRVRVAEYESNKEFKLSVSEAVLLSSWGYLIQGLKYSENTIRVRPFDIKSGIIAKAKMFGAQGDFCIRDGLVTQEVFWSDPVSVKNFKIPYGVQSVMAYLTIKEGDKVVIDVPKTVQHLDIDFNDKRLIHTFRQLGNMLVNYSQLDSIKSFGGDTFLYSDFIELKNEYDKISLPDLARFRPNDDGYIVVNSVDTLTYRGSSLKTDNLYKLKFNYLRKLGRDFDFNKNVVEVDLSDYLEVIAGAPFKSCTYLEKVNLGSRLKEIPNNCFYYCKSLKEIKIPNSVTRIGRCAFEACISLESVEVPPSVKHIDDFAFKNSGVKYLKIPNDCEVGVGIIGFNMKVERY